MKNKGCLATILAILAIILFLPFVIIGGFIYLMVKLYKSGNFDTIAFKTNEVLKKSYFKISKKEMNRNVFSPKSFTITFTILLFLIIGSFADSTKLAVDSTVTVSQSKSTTKNTTSTKISTDNKEENSTG